MRGGAGARGGNCCLVSQLAAVDCRGRLRKAVDARGYRAFIGQISAQSNASSRISVAPKCPKGTKSSRSDSSTTVMVSLRSGLSAYTCAWRVSVESERGGPADAALILGSSAADEGGVEDEAILWRVPLRLQRTAHNSPPMLSPIVCCALYAACSSSSARTAMHPTVPHRIATCATPPPLLPMSHCMPHGHCCATVPEERLLRPQDLHG